MTNCKNNGRMHQSHHQGQGHQNGKIYQYILIASLLTINLHRKRSDGNLRKGCVQRANELRNQERELQIAQEREKLEEICMKRRREELELREKELKLEIWRRKAGL